MNPETITALLALWERCPECRPEGMERGSDYSPTACVFVLRSFFDRITCLNAERSSAIAADAIERWIISRDLVLRLTRVAAVGDHVEIVKKTPSDKTRGCWGEQSIYCTTGWGAHREKLLQLISAANAVLDAEGKTT